ncbi:MAG: TlpA family protein disulfide reductase [Clostridia bacterium]|nr:TlpA family protein disulfide reductase [Clostridia bacterium]
MKKLCALFLALALLLSACAFAEEAEAAPEEPVAAPDFPLTDWDGEEILFSDLLGKPLLLNIWATWCPPCRNELPFFQQAFEKYGEEITFAFVSVDEDKADVEEFLTENGYTFPVYMDTPSSSLMTYGIGSIPVTVLIDAEGNIIAGQIGSLSEELVQLCMEMLLVDA